MEGPAFADCASASQKTRRSRTPSLPKISSACRHSVLEKLIEATVRQRCNSVPYRKAGSPEKNPVPARDEIALLHRTNGSHRRRGLTETKRRGVGIGDEVLRPEEPLRCARVLASPLLSIPERVAGELLVRP